MHSSPLSNFYRVDIGQVLGVVPGAVAHRFGQAVHLADEKARLDQIGHGLGVHRGRAAGQRFQAAQTVPTAAHHIPVDGLQQHRHHRHDFAVHGGQVAVEIFQVVAQVDGVAHDGPGDGAGQGRHMEHGQHREGAELAGIPAGLLLDVLKGQAVEVHRGKEVAVADHDALAAAGGARREQDHRQRVPVGALGAGIAPLGGLVPVHRQQLVPVSGGQGRLACGELAVVEDVDRLHQVQLILDLVPVLLQVEGHQHRAGQKDREHIDQKIVAVAGQQADLLAPDVRVAVEQQPRRPADVLGVLPVPDADHPALCLVVILNGDLAGIIRLHVVDQLIDCRDHRSHPPVL